MKGKGKLTSSAWNDITVCTETRVYHRTLGRETDKIEVTHAHLIGTKWMIGYHVERFTPAVGYRGKERSDHFSQLIQGLCEADQ